MFKKAGRPNPLDGNLIKKVKDIAIGTRSARGVINRKQILNIMKGVVKANNPSSLKKFGGKLHLSRIVNLDQTPLSYVSPGKYAFSFRGAKNVPIKGERTTRGRTPGLLL